MLVGHSDSVLDVAWQPDGDMLASAGREGSVRLWREDRLVVEWPMDGRVSCIAWSRRGDLLVAGTESGRVHCLGQCQGTAQPLAHAQVHFQRFAGEH
jgi:WD40 repeat protein